MEYNFFMNIKQETTRASLLMVLVALLWSTGGIFIKLVSWHPLTIASVRGFIAAAIIFIFIKKKGYRLKFNKYTWAISLAMVLCMTLFVTANKMTTAANAIVLQYMCPVWVLIIGVTLLKQKVKKVDVLAVLICIIGMVLFFLDQLSPGNIQGNILAILAGVALAVIFTANSACGDSEIQFTGILLGQFLTGVVGLSGFFMAPFHTTGTEILYVLILGIFQLGIPYILFAYVSSKISPLACSLIGMLEPLANPVWVAIFYGEVPGIYALIGGIVIIATTSIWCVIQSRTGE